MPEHTQSIPLAQARAFVLAKQGLAGAGLAGVYEATLATAGVYATAPTCYLSYAARVAGFRLADLDEELYARRRLVRLRCMRGSSYIEPVQALPEFVGATEHRVANAAGRMTKYIGMSEPVFLALADRIEDAMTGRPPTTVPEVRLLLGEHVPEQREAVQFAVAYLSRQMRLVRAEVRGSWRSDVYAYARWEDWLGASLERIAPETARMELARRYLRAYGPASAADLKWWAGWNVRDTNTAITALGDAVVPVALTVPDAPDMQTFLLTDEMDTLATTDAETGRGVRLLPVWDAYTMGYIERRRFLTDGDASRVYDKAGNSTSIVLIDGMAAGVWEFDLDETSSRQRLTVRVAPFGAAAIARWDEIEEAATRIASSAAVDELRVEEAPEPGRLIDGARNAFLAPIRLGPPARASEAR